MKFKSLFAATAIALAAAATPVAHADAVATYQGVTFTFHYVDSNTFTLRIQGVLDATGDWGVLGNEITHISALQFSDLGVNPSAATISPSGGFVDGGLSANACTGAGEGFCFAFNPDLASSNNDLFTIDLTAFTGTLLIDQIAHPHLKVNFTKGDDNKIGSNLSTSANWGSSSSSSSSSSTSGGINQNCTEGTCIPEPSSVSLALLGLGLLGGGFLYRRKSATPS